VTTPTGLLSGVSVSHRRAGIDEIEAVSSRPGPAWVEWLLDHEGVEEAFVLQTCNRAEAFVVTDDRETGRAALTSYVAGVPEDAVVGFDHEEGLRHLMRVAAGLESLVLGEDQILGQVREAYTDADDVGGIGPVLEDALLKAIHVGERARTETSINEGVTSLGSAAVRLAAEDLPVEVGGSSALVVGAGEMGAIAAAALDRATESVTVANRTREAAEHLAESLDGPTSVVPLAEVEASVQAADLVVTATASPRYVLGPSAFERAGETLVVDLAQPRDVDPAVKELSNVVGYDLDDLESVTAETRDRRRAAAREVEGIIEEAFENLLSQYKRKRADEVIGAMYEGAERMKSRELETALSRLEGGEADLDEEQREVIESLADSLVGQLLAAPTQSLRDAAENDDWSTINTALKLFGPGLRPGVEGDGPTVDGPPEGVDAALEDVSPEELPERVRQEMPPGILEGSGDD
jgi:glutamyl-tRNA reductase